MPWSLHQDGRTEPYQNHHINYCRLQGFPQRRSHLRSVGVNPAVNIFLGIINFFLKLWSCLYIFKVIELKLARLASSDTFVCLLGVIYFQLDGV